MIQPGVPTDQLLQFVVDQWRTLKDERRYKEELWIECFLAFENKFGKTWQNLQNYRSKRFLPLTNQAVDAVASRWTNAIMPNDSWFNVIGRTPMDDSKAKLSEGLVRWQHYKTNFRNKVSQGIRGLAIYGNQPYCVRWKQVVANIPDYETYSSNLANMAVTGEMADSLATKPLLKYEGPELELGNIFDYVQDRFADSDESCLRIQRFYKSEAYIRSLAEPDPNTGFVIFQDVDGLTDMSRTVETSDSLQNQANAKLGFLPPTKSGIEILEASGDFVIDKGGEKTVLKNYIVTIANRARVIRCEPNPYIHGRSSWRMARLFEDPGETYARGVVESILSLQDVANVRLNQVIDANSLAIDPMWQVRDNGVVNIDDLRNMPGAIIEVQQQGDIQPLTQVSQATLGLQEIGFIMSQVNQTTGAMAAFSTEDYKKSATEVASTAQAANSKDAETIRHLENTFIGPVLEDWISLNQQLMDQTITVRVMSDGGNTAADPDTGIPFQFGPNDLTISPEDIAGDFDIRPVGGEWAAMSQQEVAQSIQLLQVMMQNGGARFIKFPALWSTLSERMGLKSAWKWLKSEQEVMLEQLQQQQMALAAQGGAGANGGPGAPGIQGGPPAPSQQPGSMGVGSMAGATESKPPIPGGPSPEQLSGPSLAP